MIYDLTLLKNNPTNKIYKKFEIS